MQRCLRSIRTHGPVSRQSLTVGCPVESSLLAAKEDSCSRYGCKDCYKAIIFFSGTQPETLALFAIVLFLIVITFFIKREKKHTKK